MVLLGQNMCKFLILMDYARLLSKTTHSYFNMLYMKRHLFLYSSQRSYYCSFHLFSLVIKWCLIISLIFIPWTISEFEPSFHVSQSFVIFSTANGLCINIVHFLLSYLSFSYQKILCFRDINLGMCLASLPREEIDG